MVIRIVSHSYVFALSQTIELDFELMLFVGFALMLATSLANLQSCFSGLGLWFPGLASDSSPSLEASYTQGGRSGGSTIGTGHKGGSSDVSYQSHPNDSGIDTKPKEKGLRTNPSSGKLGLTRNVTTGLGKLGKGKSQGEMNQGFMSHLAADPSVDASRGDSGKHAGGVSGKQSDFVRFPVYDYWNSIVVEHEDHSQHDTTLPVQNDESSVWVAGPPGGTLPPGSLYGYGQDPSNSVDVPEPGSLASRYQYQGEWYHKTYYA